MAHLIAPETVAHIFGVKSANDNIRSIVKGLDMRGAEAGLHPPHRLAQYLGQVGHESARGRYDRELWNGKGAQARYDVRTDLGNTPERDGDGYKFRGRTAMQITGKANTRSFRDWCRKLFKDVPDFVANPDAMNTDPWEGLGPVWYWETRGLNTLADTGSVSNVTRRINGGYNGLEDRKVIYARAALVFLGFDPADVSGFQKSARITVDGLVGPQTLKALHASLVALPKAEVPVRPDVEPIAPKPARQTGIAALIAAIIGFFTNRKGA